MEILQVGTSSASGLGASLSFSGGTLSVKDEVRSLGFLLDSALFMESQEASVV